MLTDRLPGVDDDDDYIVAWAINHGLMRCPIAYVYLCRAVFLDEKDIAVIEFDKPGYPVTRISGRSSTML